MATSNYPGPTVAGVRAAMRDPKRPSESTPTVADVSEAANDPKRPSEFPTKREKRQEKKAQRKDDRESRRFQRTHAFVEREREEPKETPSQMRDPSRPMSDTLAARPSGLGSGGTAEPSNLTFNTRGDMDASLPADVATATRDEEAADAQLTESLDSQLADLDASDEIRAMEREARADVAANVDAVNAAQTARQDPMDAADISDLDARTRFAGPVEQMTRKELRQRYREMRPEFRQMSKGVTGATEQELKDAAEGMGAIKAEIKERRDLQRQARRVSRGRGQFSDAINNAVAKAMPSEDEAAAEDKRAEGAQQALDAAEKLGAAEFKDRGVGAPPTRITTPPAGSDRLVVPEDAITNLPEMPDDIAAAEDARLAALDDEIAPEVEVDPDTGDPLPEPEAEDEMDAEVGPSLDTDTDVDDFGIPSTIDRSNAASLAETLQSVASDDDVMGDGYLTPGEADIIAELAAQSRVTKPENVSDIEFLRVLRDAYREDLVRVGPRSTRANAFKQLVAHKLEAGKEG